MKEIKLNREVIAVVTMPYEDKTDKRRLYHAVVKGRTVRKMNSGYIVEFKSGDYFMKRYICGLKRAGLYQRFAYALIPFDPKIWKEVNKLRMEIEKLTQQIGVREQLRQVNWDNLLNNLLKLNIVEV